MFQKLCVCKNMHVCMWGYLHIHMCINAYPKTCGRVLLNINNSIYGEKSGIRKRNDEGRFFILLGIYALFFKL